MVYTLNRIRTNHGLASFTNNDTTMTGFQKVPTHKNSKTAAQEKQHRGVRQGTF